MFNLNTKQLKVIDAIIEHKSATRASAMLGISIPTISYVLKGVRQETGKNIFIRTKDGLRPDTYALALQREYLKRKNLQMTRRKYIISTIASLELPLSFFLRESTETHIDAYFSRAEMSCHKRADALRKRFIDIDIGSKLPDDNSIKSHLFFESDYCVMASQHHDSLGENLTREDLKKHAHLQWQRESIDIEKAYQHLLTTLLPARQIKCKSTNFITLAHLCSRTNFLIIAPRKIIMPYTELFPLRIYDMPDEFNLKYVCYVHYHTSMQNALKNFRFKG